MTETQTLISREPYPHGTHEIQSADKSSSIVANQHGGICMEIILNDISVLYPGPEPYKLRGVKNPPDLDKIIDLQDREKAKIVGKTNSSGKSWFAFPWGYRQARVNTKPVHGVTSNAGTSYRIVPQIDKSIAMQAGGPNNEIFRYYFGEDTYTVDRQFTIDDSTPRHTAHIMTTVTNSGKIEVDSPPGAEHFYAVGDKNAAFLRPDGTLALVNNFSDTTGKNATDNDVTLADIGYNDSLVYLPYGRTLPDGVPAPVIVFNTTLMNPDGKSPLQNFHLYKGDTNDCYVAIEPIVNRHHLLPNQSFTLDFAMTTYPSLEAYQQTISL